MKNQYKIRDSVDIYTYDLRKIIQLIDLRGSKNPEKLNKILKKYNLTY